MKEKLVLATLRESFSVWTVIEVLSPALIMRKNKNSGKFSSLWRQRMRAVVHLHWKDRCSQAPGALAGRMTWVGYLSSLPWHKRLSNCYLRNCPSSFLYFLTVRFCDCASFCQLVNHIAWIEWIYFLIFLSVSICITCYMYWLPNILSQLIVAPGNFHLSQRSYKFRSTAPLAHSEILLIIFAGLLYQCQELWKCKSQLELHNV